MEIYGEKLSLEQIRKFTSHPQQAFGCELFRSIDGDMLDQRMLRIRNGELELEILVDRGFDIGRVLYRGIPTQWVSPAGFRHPHSFTPSAMEPDGWGWLRSWPGGFLSTIGIDHVGGPRDIPNRHLHPAITFERRFTGGFISYSPTSIERIDVDMSAGTITVQATTRQAAPFAEHLVLTRKISMKIGEPKFILQDKIRNDGYIEEPIQVLYHINIGWPFLTPGAILQTSCNELLDKIQTVKEDDDPRVMPPPQAREIERVWDWKANPGIQYAEIINLNAAGRGKMSMKLFWDGNELPHFMQWRNSCESMYVQGLEPSTTGLKAQNRNNSLNEPNNEIQPGQTKHFNLEFNFAGEV